MLRNTTTLQTLSRLLCIPSLALVPILLFSRFRSGLAAVAAGFWVVGVLAFWRWLNRTQHS